MPGWKKRCDKGGLQGMCRFLCRCQQQGTCLKREGRCCSPLRCRGSWLSSAADQTAPGAVRQQLMHSGDGSGGNTRGRHLVRSAPGSPARTCCRGTSCTSASPFPTAPCGPCHLGGNASAFELKAGHGGGRSDPEKLGPKANGSTSKCLKKRIIF